MSSPHLPASPWLALQLPPQARHRPADIPAAPTASGRARRQGPCRPGRLAQILGASPLGRAPAWRPPQWAALGALAAQAPGESPRTP
eukprot:9487496-Heterocapsa_arctica.AAC.1